MTDIPDDIRKTAHALRDKLCIGNELCSFDKGCGCLDAIAEALLAERERCAQAARDFLQLEFCADYGSLPENVAEAILRSPAKAE